MIAARLAAAALGAWLMAAPDILNAGAAQSANMHITGPVVVWIGLAAAARALDGLRWLLLPCAAWLVMAPWLLGGDATTVIVGALLAALAMVRPRGDSGRGGGWRAVTPLVHRGEPHQRQG